MVCEEDSELEVSVVIPAFNEETVIGNTVDGIKAALASYFEFEIILVDNMSTDRTSIIAQELGAKVLKSSASSIAGLRNEGVKLSSGKLLVFIDADITLGDDWGGVLYKEYDELVSSNVLTGYRCLSDGTEGVFHDAWFSLLFEKPSTNYIGSAHMIMPAKLFHKVEGFNASLTTGEDSDICERITDRGGKIVPNKNFRALHHGFPRSVKQFVLREAWHGGVKSLRDLFFSPVNFASLIFSALFLLFFYGLLTASVLVSFSTLMMLILLSFGISSYKFKNLGGLLRLKNMYVVLLYLSGRALSFVINGRRAR